MEVDPPPYQRGEILCTQNDLQLIRSILNNFYFCWNLYPPGPTHPTSVGIFQQIFFYFFEPLPQQCLFSNHFELTHNVMNKMYHCIESQITNALQDSSIFSCTKYRSQGCPIWELSKLFFVQIKAFQVGGQGRFGVQTISKVSQFVLRSSISKLSKNSTKLYFALFVTCTSSYLFAIFWKNVRFWMKK